ncbi:MAG: cadherin domain-containing protein [Planctomycetaceae bacterium]
MFKTSGKSRRRRLAMEPLEKRQVLTATISEVMIDPLFGSQTTNQYFELRGDPNATLEAGTYLLVINEHDTGLDKGGAVQAIFDLSNQQFGSNGFLVLQQQNSPYPLGAGLVAGGEAPNVLMSNATGFSGLPGNLFSSVDGSGYIDLTLGSAGYFLIQTDVVPNLGDDIDADDDGVIDVDGPFQSWTVLDSISLHHNVFQGPFAYGQIVYAEVLGSTKPAVAVQDGAELIYTEGQGYAARIGDSTGHTSDDWVVGTVRDTTPGAAAPRYRLENGIFGIPLPRPFVGRDLDHLGESNFIGGVRGVIAEQGVNSDGELVTVPVEGMQFLADTNANGVRDVLQYDADPDQFAVGTELTNLYPGITLTTVSATDQVFGFEVDSRAEDFRFPNGNRVFAQSGIDWFDDSGRLRIDFYRPARSVGIEAIGGSSFSPTYGRLEAFNAAGESLGFIRSRALFGSDRQQLRLNYSDDVIAYALAYSDNQFLNSSPFGQFDNLEYRQSEAFAVTDANGEFELEALQPDTYEIVPLANTDVIFADPLPITPITITRYENFDLSFTAVRNTPPSIDELVFASDENVAVGQSIGTVTATDPDLNQTITFSLADDNAPVTIDPATGELLVRDSAAFDFETSTSLLVTVIATDSVGGSFSRDVEIQLSDVNEPPLVTIGSYSVSEEADQGSAFGRLDAFDPEFPDESPAFSVVGGTGAGLFSIDATTGVLRVADAESLDFEQGDALTLQVAVADQSSPPLVSTVELTIFLVDANDPPTITSDSFNVFEDFASGESVGTIEFTEVDFNQSQTFSLLEGGDGLFAIEPGTGNIILLGELDFETTTQYELLVQIVDNGTPPQGSSKTITINVLDRDEPAVLANTEFSIEEDAVPGGVIGILSAMDPEGLEGLTFASIDTSNPTRLFGGLIELNSVNGNLTVAADAVLDAEAEVNVISDRVQILSGANVVGEALLTLTIEDINESPSIPPQQFVVPKGLPSGRGFAAIEFSDPENDEVTIEVIGSAAGLFEVDDSQRLSVRPGVVIDFAANPVIDLELRIIDSNGLSTTSVSTVVEGPRPRFGTPLADQSFVSGALAEYQLPAAYRAESIRNITLTGPDGELPPGLRFDPVIARLSGIASHLAEGVYPILVQVLQLDGDADVLKEETFTITVTRSETPLFNSASSLDVDGDGVIQPLDALRIINLMMRKGIGSANDLADLTPFFVDTNGNNEVTPLDALLVINFLSRRARGLVGGSEGSGQLVGQAPEERDAHDTALSQWLSEASIF